VRVLLTGANGFIGSHILDRLLEQGCDVAVLLRKTSDTRFIKAVVPRVDVRYGSVESPESLADAVRGAETVIHCAGKTKALRKAEYYAVNAEGTRNVVAACNASAGSVRHLIHISSLSVSGPGTVESPAREDAPPRPVSVYGKSKALGEEYVRRESRVPYTVLRPAAVYGPRDSDLFLAFKAARAGILPLVGGGRQYVSFVYAADVAAAALKAMDRTAPGGEAYHVAHPAPWRQKDFLAKIAEVMGAKALPVFIPRLLLYPACLAHGLWSRVTSRPSILSLQKVAELTAPGWVCSTERAATALGFVARTPLDEGIKLTFDWYRANGWL
jgi:nucleoside-diphosphate-sugar epimerase